MSAKILRVALASFLVASGLLLLLSFFLSIGTFSPAEGAGFFLFASFGYAGLWVPVYIIWAGILLLLSDFPLWQFLWINIVSVPVFFLALALRAFTDPLADKSPLINAMIISFTRLGTFSISLLLSIVSFLLSLRLLPLLRSRFPSIEALFPPSSASGDPSVFSATEKNERDETVDSSDTASLDTDDSRIMSPDSVIARIATRTKDKVRLVEWEHVDNELEYDDTDTSDTEEQSDSYDDISDNIVESEQASFLPAVQESMDDGCLSSTDKYSSREIPAEDSTEIGRLESEHGDYDIPEDFADRIEVSQHGNVSSHALRSAETYEKAREEIEDKPSYDSENKTATYSSRAAGGATLSAYIENYRLPVDGILKNYPEMSGDRKEEIRQAGELLLSTLAEFGIDAELIGIRRGPVITMFEILPAPGVKLSKIVNLSDNIALRLAAQSVRIVAPIPGKRAVGVEIPNRERELVSMRSLMEDGALDGAGSIPVVLGRDITGEPQVVDLAQTPHLLIAGATGSGKSVCVNSMICSILYTRAPQEVRLMLIDPKIVELKLYNDIPHLLTPVVTDPKKAFQALQYCVYEMERRYALLDAVGARDIKTYNSKIKKERLAMESLPYIVIVIDEFADLMATSGKELESILARLAAMSRAVGLHLVLATQRPSIDVITGLIKANIPSRIAFMVASKFDSRIIMDAVGAEKLLGKGDMLFTSPWQPFPLRIQGAFVSEEEVENLVDYLRDLSPPDYIDDIIFTEEEENDLPVDELEDPLMEKAIEIVLSTGKASASYLQRRLKVGYNRAARMIENMEYLGIVGPANGSKPREILDIPEEYQKYVSERV
ncbi:DNA translocase FtsK [Spirochaetia bacterium 38H-sp]|uniref:DNA translocase FtsK n=1 Tax=Rarispira pelagica TaxID=3141764 RepID=A0ABU9UD05_9SPIR